MPDRFATPAFASSGPPLVKGDRRPVCIIEPLDIEKTYKRPPRPRKEKLGFARAFKVLPFLSVAVPALVLRLYELNALGFNSDEAVYAGQAASIAGQPAFLESFPIFRAHPLLFQTVLSVVYQGSVSDLAGRLCSVAFGLGAIVMTYLLGRELYGRRVGYVAALLLAVMPYHVLVSRQVLLDGPMTFFATMTLYLIARHSSTGRSTYLYASAGALGLTVLCKEPAVLLLGAVYAYYAVTRVTRLSLRQLIVASAVFGLTILPFPLSVMFSGRSSTGQQFLSYQIFRRPNHTWSFYFTEVPPAVGVLTVVVAVAGLFILARQQSWREGLLCCWIAVPFAFFELWPVKGFQYLLPLAPALAVLAARAIVLGAQRFRPSERHRQPVLTAALVAVLAVSLALPAWDRIQPDQGNTTFLAGSGGVAGGRDAGEWIAANIPVGAKMLAVGPSMANVIQFYGHRKTYGLSVSPNPLHRNPVYEPVLNPDNLIRQNEIQYLVWDVYSSNRTQFFSNRLLTYTERYHGRIVHTETMQVTGPDGTKTDEPVIVIYEVRP